MIENEAGATPTNSTPETNVEPTAGSNQGTNVAEVTPTVDNSTPEQQKVERTYTKAQVQQMMRNRINRSHQAFFNRYKVKDLKELDASFAKIANYEKQIADLGVTNAGLVKDNAYLKHNINPERYGDIEAYFKGKDLKIDSDTLAQEIIAHPEWVKAVVQPLPQTTIKTLSPQRGHTVVETEEERADRIFGKI